MPSIKPEPNSVVATAQELLLQFGVAYLVDEWGHAWTLTKAAQGPGLETLRIGQQVELMLDAHAGITLIQAYRALN